MFEYLVDEDNPKLIARARYNGHQIDVMLSEDTPDHHVHIIKMYEEHEDLPVLVTFADATFWFTINQDTWDLIRRHNMHDWFRQTVMLAAQMSVENMDVPDYTE